MAKKKSVVVVSMMMESGSDHAHNVAQMTGTEMACSFVEYNSNFKGRIATAIVQISEIVDGKSKIISSQKICKKS